MKKIVSRNWIYHLVLRRARIAAAQSIPLHCPPAVSRPWPTDRLWSPLLNSSTTGHTYIPDQPDLPTWPTWSALPIYLTYLPDLPTSDLPTWPTWLDSQLWHNLFQSVQCRTQFFTNVVFVEYLVLLLLLLFIVVGCCCCCFIVVVLLLLFCCCCCCFVVLFCCLELFFSFLKIIALACSR